MFKRFGFGDRLVAIRFNLFACATVFCFSVMGFGVGNIDNANAASTCFDNIGHTISSMQNEDNANNISVIEEEDGTIIAADTGERYCKYTYIVHGVKKHFIVCAPACPQDPSWQDIGPCPY